MNVRILLCLLFITTNLFAKTREELIADMKTASLEATSTNDPKRLDEIYEKYKSMRVMLRTISQNKNISKELSLKLAKKALERKSERLDTIGRITSFRVMLAKNPGAAPEALEMLSKIKVSRGNFFSFIHKALASNPNTPYKVLHGLSKYYDYAVDLATNPSYKKKDLVELFDSLEKLPTVTGNARLGNSGQRIMLKFLKNKKTTKKISQQIYLETVKKKAWWITLKETDMGDISYTLKNMRRQAIKLKAVECKWVATKIKLDKVVKSDLKEFCSN